MSHAPSGNIDLRDFAVVQSALRSLHASRIQAITRELTMFRFRSMGLVAAVLCAAGGASAAERIKKR